MNDADLMQPARANLALLPGDDQVLPEPSEQFVLTPYVQQLTEHALSYLAVGYALHFAGPAGTGKTTLAFHVAAQRARPVILIHGDDEFSSSDLVGRDAGYRKQKLVDNFIHSVLKTEETMSSLWMDNRLTTACQEGHTLIYDEFNRSRPEANNALLSVLEEGILNLPKMRRSGKGYLRVHPDFRAIFTSNPEEYAGIHKAQDALMDRLITIHTDHFDRDTEIQIVISKSGIPQPEAARVVDVVRELRGVGVNSHRPRTRACIMIARMLAHCQGHAELGDPVFQWVCRDVLSTDTAKVTRNGQSVVPQMVDEAIGKVCGGPRPRRNGDRGIVKKKEENHGDSPKRAA
jgi:nitric oxide reductase NorQ protein